MLSFNSRTYKPVIHTVLMGEGSWKKNCILRKVWQ